MRLWDVYIYVFGGVTLSLSEVPALTHVIVGPRDLCGLCSVSEEFRYWAGGRMRPHTMVATVSIE